MTGVEHLDVVIVGAGLSGIGAARRLQQEHPDKTFVLLEARANLGGTWDLFKYPGLRSDSDMFTLSYPFKPWRGTDSIADGESILDYIAETAAETGIGRKIRYDTRVVAADWDSAEARWTLTLERASGPGESAGTVTCGFLYACAGYFDYANGYTPDFLGVESFTGTVAHPQLWPADLDCTGKQVAVIGSGATAITMVPTLARGAAHVTMVQRSPTWIIPQPRRDPIADGLRAVLPPGIAHHAIRLKNIGFASLVYWFCRTAPRAASALMKGLATLLLRDRAVVAEHFTPRYAPWDQRLCVAVDADLFRAIRGGTVSMATDQVDAFVPEGVRLRSGRVVEADVVVTATGLSMAVFGGVECRVDGRPVKFSDEFLWQGTMVSGMPNFAVGIGYSNAAWTLRADLNARLVCRVLRHIDRHGGAPVVPKPARPMAAAPFLGLTSGYVQRSVDQFPHLGDQGPWRVRGYLRDLIAVRFGRLRELTKLRG
ncbi:MAG TPA: NAD(P)/FAD-dependent oxidoreductase [Umezawaea sp.]|nr:NAD(P)/FAD-dependent oxidoreductase [Umezawaea sp.]